MTGSDDGQGTPAFAVSAAVLAAGFVAAFLLIQAERDDLPDTHAAN